MAALLVVVAPSALAQRAVLVLDVDSGHVLHAEHPRRLAYPASLTKLMTLYVLFQAIDEGELTLQDEVTVSQHAAATVPTKMGLEAGTRIDVETAIKALTVISANDIAVAVAETIAGSEGVFSERMNLQSEALGMSDTNFENASGLPDPAQVTSARDMTLLALALQTGFSRFAHYFKLSQFSFAGRTYRSHNNFVLTYGGAMGMKTGFTCRAGYNLVAVAKRNGRKLIGVDLGERTSEARNSRLARLFDAAFETRDVHPLTTIASLTPDAATRSPNQAFLADECINPQAGGKLYRVSQWSVEFGLEVEQGSAVRVAREFISAHRKELQGGRPMLIPTWARDMIYRVGVTGLTQENATRTCLKVRDKGGHCIVLPNESATAALDRALKTMEWLATKQVQNNP